MSKDSTGLKILFASSDAIALKTLMELRKNFEVVGILTSPLQQNSRKKVENPILDYAVENKIAHITPEHLKSDEREWVEETGANFLLSFSYSKIFGPKFLSLFSKGTMNIHPSLLPQYRGPSPLQAALLAGDNTSAISFQTIALGMDEGDIYKSISFDIPPSCTLTELRGLVAELSANCVGDVLINHLSLPVKQEGQASYTHLISTSSGRINWQEDTAELIWGKFRAYTPWPRLWCYWNGKKLFFDKISLTSTKSFHPAGTVFSYSKSEKAFLLSTLDTDILIHALTPEGKKPQLACDFKNGHPDFLASVLS